MSDADNAFPGFGKLVPGFDFLQTLAKQAAGSASQSLPQMPNLANWIAPTLNVEELDKRIQELKSVQFWLDQNATALKATVQALEVQKMTLATLKGMNFNMGDVANAFKLKVADTARTFAGLEVPPSAFQASQADADDEDEDEEEDVEEAAPPPKPRAAARAPKSAKPAPAAAPPAGVVDPMQWWGALTQQFQTIAADAMKDAAKQTAVNATKGLAKDAMKTATGMARGVAKGMADSAGKTVAGGARAMSSALRSTQAWPTPGAAATQAKPKAAAKKTPARKAARKTSR